MTAVPAREALDFSAQIAHVPLLLPEIVLAATAIGVLLVDVFRRGDSSRQSDPVVPALALAGVVAAMGANAFLLTLSPVSGADLMAVDAFRVASNFVILAGTLLGLLLARDYLEREGLLIGEFYALVLFATFGMLILVGAQNLVLTFLGLETMSIAVYVLTAFNRRDPRSAEAGLKYFLVGAFASAFFVYGVALLYGATGTVSLPEMAARVGPAMEQGNLLLWGGLGLLLVGFGFKVSAVPFHMWAPDAYQGAPTPVTGYMAAAVKAAAFLALVRVLGALEPVRGIWESAVWWLAMLTMIVPNLVALAQDDVKRMLAYSSVAHAGYILVGVTAGGRTGVAAALFYLAVYTLMTLGAFGILYLVAGKGDRRSHLGDFRGMGWKRPVMGVALVLFLLSLAGFPPTGGFVGKLYLLRAAVDTGHLVLAVTLVLTSLVAYFYYLRVVWKMYFEEAPAGAVAPETPGGTFRLAAAVCALGVLAAGVVPGVGIRGAELAAPAPTTAAAPAAEAPAVEAPGSTADARPADGPAAARELPGSVPARAGPAAGSDTLTPERSR
jgi:NADH-quinone oxidoreductase subunit N